MKHSLCSARLGLQDRHGTTPGNPTTRLAETGGLQVRGQPQLQVRPYPEAKTEVSHNPIYYLTSYRSARELPNSTASHILQPPCDPTDKSCTGKERKHFLRPIKMSFRSFYRCHDSDRVNPSFSTLTTVLNRNDVLTVHCLAFL